MKFSMLAKDYSMAPVIMKGDLIFVDQRVQSSANGRDLAVIKVRGKMYICRYIVYGSYFYMIQESQIKAFKMGDVEVLGKIIKVSKKDGAPPAEKKIGF